MRPLASSRRGGRIAGNLTRDAGGITPESIFKLKSIFKMRSRSSLTKRPGPGSFSAAARPGPLRPAARGPPSSTSPRLNQTSESNRIVHRSSDHFPPRLAVTTTLVSAQAGPTSSMLGFPAAWGRGPACRLNIIRRGPGPAKPGPYGPSALSVRVSLP